MTRLLISQSRSTILVLCLFAITVVLPAAGVDGAWNLVFITEVGDRPFPVTLKSDGENVSGPFMNQEFKGTYRDGKLMLKLTDFYSPDAGFKADLSIEGTVKGEQIEGTWSFGEYSGPMKGTKGGAASATAASVNGTWNFTFLTEAGDKSTTIALRAKGEQVIGTVGDAEIQGTFKDGVLALKAPNFYSPDAGFRADLSFQGPVNGDSMEGRWTFAEYSGVVKGAKVQ